jgi:hypothetical protein
VDLEAKKTIMRNDLNLVGKRISVLHPKWPGQRITGICQSCGVNPLHGHMQVTIDRMPIWPVKVKEIIVLKDETNENKFK